MYQSIAEFQKDWQDESQSTLKVLNALTDESLSTKVYNEGRSIKDIAWHIVTTLTEMGNATGIKISGPMPESDAPTSSADIAAAYEKLSKNLVNCIALDWNDTMLAEVINMYGEQWTRAKALTALVRHEIHHRAQLTVLMRQAGVPVPGVYGPSKEEWAAYGMPPQK
jgi:uncharacterized damage-inducible protein DinB